MANDHLEVAANRYDPYKNFKFRIKFDGRTVAGFSTISALNQSTELVAHRETVYPIRYRSPHSAVKSESITLERGIILDDEFISWANKVWDVSTPMTRLNDFKRDITIDLLNESGQTVIA